MRRNSTYLAISTGIALFGIASAAVLGAKVLSLGEVVSLFTDPTAPLSALVWTLRAPRALTAFLVGSCLGLSGALFQGTFRNPLAEPYLLGSSAGASLGAAISLLLPLPLPQAVSLPLFAFIGAWASTASVLVLSGMARISDTAGVLLVGVAIGAMLAAARSLVTLVYSDETSSLRSVISWMLGGIQTPSTAGLVALGVLTLLCLIVSLVLAPGLDALGLGEETAKSMGLSVEKFRTVTVMLGAAAAGLAVTWGGVIGFIGLMAPHLVRWSLGGMHRRLLWHCTLVGGGLLAFLDGLSRTAAAPSEIPIGLMTALVGGPFFFVLLARRGR